MDGLKNLLGRPVTIENRTIAPAGELRLAHRTTKVGRFDGLDLYLDEDWIQLDGKPIAVDDLFEVGPLARYIVDESVARYIACRYPEYGYRFVYVRDDRLIKAVKETIEPRLVERWMAGLECGMAINPLGTLNGYVRLPTVHPCRFSDMRTLNQLVRVHGGITWGPDDDGWLGWDTLHRGDYIPGVQDGQEWDEAAVRAETELLAEQLYGFVDEG